MGYYDETKIGSRDLEWESRSLVVIPVILSVSQEGVSTQSIAYRYSKGKRNF